MKTKQNSSKVAGFSLAELLSVVAVTAVITGIGFGVISKTHQDVRAAKLNNDVKSLNEAVQVYRANGGSMEGVSTLETALTKLKTCSSNSKLVGLRGAMLDARYEADMLTAAESASSKQRALWSETKKRFVLATSGVGGAEAFYLNEDAADVDPIEEARDTAVEYATTTNWVWDYADTGLSAPSGVSGFGSTSVSHSGYTPITAPNAIRLSAPNVSVSGGLFSYYDFDLAVELTDSNPAGTSQIFYTLDDSFWHIYAGSPVIVAADQTLKAYSVSMDAAAYADSDFNVQHYGSTFTISGSASGDFLNPEGPRGMVTNLTGGKSGNFFSFGTAIGTPDPSWLLFNGAGFTNVGADESFLLGSINYYNGTIRGGTQAESVGLSIKLGFDGGVQSLDFNFELDLISTANLEGNTAEQSADFVKLGNLYSDVPVKLGGISYNLILEFGETSTGGFSSIDEFHVFEGSTASGNLYGRLVKVTEEES